MSSKKRHKKADEIYDQYKKQQEAELDRKYPNRERVVSIVTALLVICFALVFGVIDVYRVTFIPLPVAILIWLLPAAFTTPLFYPILKNYVLSANMPASLSIWLHLLINAIVVGNITIISFLFLNYYFPKAPAYRESLTIQSIGISGSGRYGYRSPYVIVNYKGKEKQLYFPTGTNLTFYHYVHLQIEEGYFGFEIILDKSLSATQ